MYLVFQSNVHILAVQPLHFRRHLNIETFEKSNLRKAAGMKRCVFVPTSQMSTAVCVYVHAHKM